MGIVMGSHWGNSLTKKDRNIPTTSPAEVLKISPENLEIANYYLQYQNLPAVAEKLDVPLEDVIEIMGRREVKAYVDNVFMDMGYNNRLKMRTLMDEIIKKKLEDMDANDLGSEKDIVDILSISHKMTMEILDKEIALEKAKQANIKNQTNVQINDNSGGKMYGTLMERLLQSND